MKGQVMNIKKRAIVAFISMVLSSVSCIRAMGQNTDFKIVGQCSYYADGDTIEIAATEVINNEAPGNVSGTLELVVWATATPYEGGPINGYIMCTADLGQLAGGYYLSGLAYNETYYAPPLTSYYTTMALEEWDGAEFVIVDYVNFTTPPTDYTVLTGASPAHTGTTTGGGTYAAGTTITQIATPAAGYQFVEWT